MNKSHESQEARYWAHGIISDLIEEYLGCGAYEREMRLVFGDDAYGLMKAADIKAEIEHFMLTHDKRRVLRPRSTKHKPKKGVFSGRRTGGPAKKPKEAATGKTRRLHAV